MSQSRNRRPVSRAREPPRAAAPPADYVTSDAKENYGNKNTYKIPKSVRYDLENALVGLCDIWFEEIKPHLVKNKLKLHTGGALNEDLEPAREHRSSHEEPRRAPGRLLDPGAASDVRCPAASYRAYSTTRPAASRAPCPRPPSPARLMPLSPNNFRKLLQLPDDKRTRQPTMSTPAPPPLTQTYQRNANKSTNQWMRPPVQETPLRKPSPPFIRTRTHQKKDHHSPEKRATDSRKELSGRRPTRSPSPSSPIYQQYGHNVLKQDNRSNRKKRKSKKIRKPKFSSLSQQPPRQVSRPCCTACALAANAQTANIPQRTLAATRLPLPRTKNTLPSKPPTDNKNANSKLRNFDIKIPRVSYPRHEPTAGAIPLPPRIRISPAGDVLPSSQITAGNSPFLYDSSGTQNVFVRNPTEYIHFLNTAPVPPKFGHNLPTPLRATNISPAGDVQPFSHIAVGNSSSLNIAAGNCLPLQNFTGIRNPIVRKPSQNYSANTVPVPPKLERNQPSQLCGTNISPVVGNPSSLHDAAGDSPHPSDFAGSRYPHDGARTALMRPYLRRKSPCPLRPVGILPSPAHAKCMSSSQARSQSPVLSPVSPPPSEDEIWFHRVFEQDLTRQRGTLPQIKENSVQVHDISTSSSIPIHEGSNFHNEYNHPLFSKDLIDLIGDKNDERLRVIYENPATHDSHPSVMHLVGSRNKTERKTASKKMPWR